MSDVHRTQGSFPSRDIEQAPHLSDETLNAYLDGALTHVERDAASEHLVSCQQCQTALSEIRALRALLGALPEARLTRSFQLGSEFSRPTMPSQKMPPQWSGTSSTTTDSQGGRVLPFRSRPRLIGGIAAMLAVVLVASIVGMNLGADDDGANQDAAFANPTATSTAPSVMMQEDAPVADAPADEDADAEGTRVEDSIQSVNVRDGGRMMPGEEQDTAAIEENAGDASFREASQAMPERSAESIDTDAAPENVMLSPTSASLPDPPIVDEVSDGVPGVDPAPPVSSSSHGLMILVATMFAMLIGLMLMIAIVFRRFRRL